MAADPNVQNQLDDFMLSTRESSKARGGDRNLLRSGRYDDDDDEFSGQSATWESGLILGKILPLSGQASRCLGMGRADFSRASHSNTLQGVLDMGVQRARW